MKAKINVINVKFRLTSDSFAWSRAKRAEYSPPGENETVTKESNINPIAVIMQNCGYQQSKL